MLAQEEPRWSSDFLSANPMSRAYDKGVVSAGSHVGCFGDPAFDDVGIAESCTLTEQDVYASTLAASDCVDQDITEDSTSGSDHDDSGEVSDDDMEEGKKQEGFYDPWSSSEDECDVTPAPMHQAPSPVRTATAAIQPNQALNEPLFLTYRKLAAARDAPALMRKKIPVSGGGLDAKGAAARIRGDMKRERHNSTNTCLVCSVIPAPIVKDLVHCVSSAVQLHVERHSRESGQHVYFNLFDENLFPLTKDHVEQKEVPTVDTIYNFLQPIFDSERLGAEICVMTLVYIERVMSWKNVAMLPCTWRRVCLGALILASKVWEDQSVWNVDFVHCFDNVNAQDLGRLERNFLNLIEFNVGLKASVYVKYFIALQDYSKQPRIPETSAANHLESITHEKQAEMKTVRSRRTNSTSSLPLASDLLL